MNLMGNQLRAYAFFVLYGKEISLQLDGRIETQGGYIRLTLIAHFIDDAQLCRPSTVRLTPESRQIPAPGPD